MDEQRIMQTPDFSDERRQLKEKYQLLKEEYIIVNWQKNYIRT